MFCMQHLFKSTNCILKTNFYRTYFTSKSLNLGVWSILSWQLSLCDASAYFYVSAFASKYTLVNQRLMDKAASTRLFWIIFAPFAFCDGLSLPRIYKIYARPAFGHMLMQHVRWCFNWPLPICMKTWLADAWFAKWKKRLPVSSFFNIVVFCRTFETLISSKLVVSGCCALSLHV